MQILVPSNTVPIACITLRTTVQNKEKRPKNLSCRAGELRATTWKMFRVNLLSHCVTTHFVPVITLRWVSNSLQHKHTTLYNVFSRARQQSSLHEVPEKRHLSTIPHGNLKCTKECNPSNTMQYCDDFFFLSIFPIICELERREKKN